MQTQICMVRGKERCIDREMDRLILPAVVGSSLPKRHGLNDDEAAHAYSSLSSCLFTAACRCRQSTNTKWAGPKLVWGESAPL